ncbi:UNKNOWN [Stylonychia lemnae]|uniref:Uncharacterized protein n=1 Tax=Stylonychia lemnae TaxID=5949 RepID=A0A078A3V1_STYLE|nr:UNKNOWN [Stylonychia lemnae]|eukprot:CDW76203.1 UNKNOWN [Stylonychia lemnae]
MDKSSQHLPQPLEPRLLLLDIGNFHKGQHQQYTYQILHNTRQCICNHHLHHRIEYQVSLVHNKVLIPFPMQLVPKTARVHK